MRLLREQHRARLGGTLHPGEGTVKWSRRTDGMGVQEGRGDRCILLPFAESVMRLGLITEKIGTPPIR